MMFRLGKVYSTSYLDIHIGPDHFRSGVQFTFVLLNRGYSLTITAKAKYKARIAKIQREQEEHARKIAEAQ